MRKAGFEIDFFIREKSERESFLIDLEFDLRKAYMADNENSILGSQHFIVISLCYMFGLLGDYKDAKKLDRDAYLLTLEEIFGMELAKAICSYEKSGLEEKIARHEIVYHICFVFGLFDE